MTPAAPAYYHLLGTRILNLENLCFSDAYAGCSRLVTLRFCNLHRFRRMGVKFSHRLHRDQVAIRANPATLSLDPLETTEVEFSFLRFELTSLLHFVQNPVVAETASS